MVLSYTWCMYVISVQHNLQIGICSNARELETCQREVEKKQQELLYARTTTVNISRVDIDIGSSWQYTNSTFSPSVTVVKVENHLGKNSVQNLQLGYTMIIKQ